MVGSRGPSGDIQRLRELLPVVLVVDVHAAWILERAHPHIAEGLRRSGGISRAFRSGEEPAVIVPGQYRITRGGRSHMRVGRIRRRVLRIAGDEGADKRSAAVFRAVVPGPYAPDPVQRP